jgi:hypothetical protein
MQLGKSVIIHDAPAKSEYLLISDVHFDNPKCDRKLLKRHLDEAKQRNAKILINGDFFCVMQGLTDKRHTKGDLLPQHKGPNYFDLILEDACEFFKPYAKNILMFGYGNHETSVLKRGEHNMVSNFIYRMKYEHGADIQEGGYGGWVVIRSSVGQHTRSTKMKYYHGSGGGGPVTKGVIANQRMMAMVQGADIIWQGHVHELYHHLDMAETLESFQGKYLIQHRMVHHVRTAGYKEEYGEGSGGFHVERGRPIKPLGSYWMTIEVHQRGMAKGQHTKDITFTMAL